VPDYDHDPFIEQIASELRRPVRLDPRFDERVMAALDAPMVIPLPGTSRRSWRERRWSISVTPLGGLAAAAAVALFAWLGAQRLSDGGLTRLASRTAQVQPVANVARAERADMVETQFTFFLPGAKSVALIGDFNGWDATGSSMQQLNPDGMWAITVPLSIGRHEYQFLVNGEQHVNDPTAPQVSSDFDSPNSVITVAPRSQ